MYVQTAALVLNAQKSLQNDGELHKLGSLSRLKPALRAAHMGNAGCGRAAVYPPDILVNDLRLIAGGFNARGLRDQSRHNGTIAALGFELSHLPASLRAGL